MMERAEVAFEIGKVITS